MTVEPSSGSPVAITMLLAILLPVKMARLPKAGCQPFFAGAPPLPLDCHQHNRAWAEHSPESLFPISRVHNFGRNSQIGFLNKISQFPFEVLRVDVRVV